jgi:hypothetical protein
MYIIRTEKYLLIHMVMYIGTVHHVRAPNQRKFLAERVG